MSLSQNQMRNCPPTLSRTNLIAQHVFACIRETNLSMLTFASNVREIYEKLPDHQRDVEFSTHNDIHARFKRDAEKLERYLSKLRLPCDLEDAIVLALPEVRRAILEAELANRRGIIVVTTNSNGNVDLTIMLKEVGEAITAVACSDGDTKIREFKEAAAALTSVAEQIENGDLK